ncbi:TIGR04222 domain-containing membrane protein [Kitasatospora sp. NPDC101801]|uniref:TIGR04222 domain-containing membrane protein n=1 Tax=Kitasatospora sp. NPDC101801 TaxID=3364103 RepID=UPI0038252165
MWLLLLVPALLAAVLSCLRLVRAAATADSLAGPARSHPVEPVGVGLYETAYLAGGPVRVVELALVLMTGRGRLHLAHTGWTSVVDPHGRSRLERALIAAIGPEGQCRTGELRDRLASHPIVLEIGGRLVQAGLATPRTVRESTSLAVRQVRQALLLSVALLGAALAVAAPGTGDAGSAVAWFSLPIILTSGTLLMARVDVHPYTRWATPAGQELLTAARLPHQAGAPDEPPPGLPDAAERELLTAVAVVGPAALPDARLRAALRN